MVIRKCKEIEKYFQFVVDEVMGTARINRHCYLLFFIYLYILRVCVILMLANAWQILFD